LLATTSAKVILAAAVLAAAAAAAARLQVYDLQSLQERAAADTDASAVVPDANQPFTLTSQSPADGMYYVVVRLYVQRWHVHAAGTEVSSTQQCPVLVKKECFSWCCWFDVVVVTPVCSQPSCVVCSEHLSPPSSASLPAYLEGATWIDNLT
jgi:hypothetical protein